MSAPFGPPHIEVRDLAKRWVTRDATVAALEDISLAVATRGSYRGLRGDVNRRDAVSDADSRV